MMCIQFLLVSKRIGSIDTLLLQMMDHFLLQKYFYATFMNVGINFGPENWRRKKNEGTAAIELYILYHKEFTIYYYCIFPRSIFSNAALRIVFYMLRAQEIGMNWAIGNRNCSLRINTI